MRWEAPLRSTWQLFRSPWYAIGLAVAYLSGRIVASQIYAIRASDPLMLGGAIILVVGITVLATMLPAWRASRLAPSGVLHAE